MTKSRKSIILITKNRTQNKTAAVFLEVFKIDTCWYYYIELPILDIPHFRFRHQIPFILKAFDRI